MKTLDFCPWRQTMIRCHRSPLLLKWFLIDLVQRVLLILFPLLFLKIQSFPVHLALTCMVISCGVRRCLFQITCDRSGLFQLGRNFDADYIFRIGMRFFGLLLVREWISRANWKHICSSYSCSVVWCFVQLNCLGLQGWTWFHFGRMVQHWQWG